MALLLTWYIIGMVGATLGTLSDLADGYDFTVSDLLLCLFISIFGPFTFALGLVAYASNRKVGRFNKILIKAKK